ncbi:MAG TPA: Calx-beta domain-containing protein, partial [Woeseiaceae bacterium]
MQRRQNAAADAAQSISTLLMLRRIAGSIALGLVLIGAAPGADAQVVVSVAATDAEAGESPADNGQFTVSRVGNTIAAVTVFYEVSGSATAGADYAALSGNVSLGLLQSTATIAVTVTGDDKLFEGDETVTIRLLSSSSV